MLYGEFMLGLCEALGIDLEGEEGAALMLAYALWCKLLRSRPEYF
jgi:hypothetical protein